MRHQIEGTVENSLTQEVAGEDIKNIIICHPDIGELAVYRYFIVQTL